MKDLNYCSIVSETEGSLDVPGDPLGTRIGSLFPTHLCFKVSFSVSLNQVIPGRPKVGLRPSVTKSG